MKILKKIRWHLFPQKKKLIKTLHNTWNNFGQNDPFYSVITYEKYKDKNLSKENLEEFYSSPPAQACTKYVDLKLQEHKGTPLSNFKNKRGLDFGCGVGRNLIHLAPNFKEFTGLDISQGLLNLAQKKCQDLNLNNIKLIKSNEKIEDLDHFDFIFSVITLQHIPPPLMKSYLFQLLNLLKPQGIAFIHLPIKRHGYKYNEEKCIQKKSPLSWQMHILPLKKVKKIISITNCKLIEFDTTQDYCGGNWENGVFIIEKL